MEHCEHGDGANFNLWIEDLMESIHRKSYKPPAVRRVWIPKPGKPEKRPIGVPTVVYEHYSAVPLKYYLQFMSKTSSIVIRRKVGARCSKGYVTWEKFQAIKGVFPLLRPKFSIPYEVLNAYAML